MFAEAVGILVHAIQPEGNPVVKGLVKISRESFDAVRPSQRGNLVYRREARLFGHTVDNASATAAAEDQSIGSLQRFNPLEVVEVAIILDVVAHAIEEEI